MDYTIEYKPKAIANLEKLNRSVQERIFRKINWLAANFDQITPEQLTGNLAGFFKLRVGDYRVIYDYRSEEKIITIYQIGHRREIYN